MSCNYNQATLAGRITKEPELKILSTTSKLAFTLAVNRGRRKENHENKTDFIPVILWGKCAELGTSLLKKGSPILVWGKIRVSTYEKNSEKKWITEVVAENFQLLDRKIKEPRLSEAGQ